MSLNSSRIKTLALSFIVSALLLPAVGNQASAQDSTMMNWDLSRLRGSWEYHTFDDKWTLEFQSDHKMTFDREDARYIWTAGALRININDNEQNYPYKIADNELTLTLPDGSSRTYKKTDGGESEQSVKGLFSTAADSANYRWQASFDGKGIFSLHDSIGNDRGLYRVEGRMVILTFEDNSVDEGQIKFYDDDAMADGILLDDKLYETKDALASAPLRRDSHAVPIDTYNPPPGVPYGGPPIFMPPPPPPPAIIYNSAPQTTQASPSKQEKNDKPKATERKFGNKRPRNK